MKFIKSTLLILTLLLLITPAFAAITQDEAWNISNKYAKTDETIGIAEIITYQSHPYYYVEYSKNGYVTGVLILDAENGEIVKDENIWDKITFTHYYLYNVTNESIAGYNISAETFKSSVLVCEQKAELYKKELQYYKEGHRNQISPIVDSYAEAAELFGKMAVLCEEHVIVQSAVVNGDRSYENAMILYDYISDYEKILYELDPVYDEIGELTDVYYDILIENANYYQVNKTLMEDYKIVSQNAIKQEKNYIIQQQIAIIEKDRNDTQERMTLDKKLIKERIESVEIPGFGVLIAISSILTVGFLLRKKK